MASRAAGENLSRYPRPNVAIDVAVLTVRPAATPQDDIGELLVLVEERTSAPSGPVLPGRFLRPGETVAECVATTLAAKAGLAAVDRVPRLLRVFDDPHRDERGWALSIGHSLTITPRTAESATGRWVRIGPSGAPSGSANLLFDHTQIVRAAVDDLRDRYERAPDPGRLLEATFTMTELRLVHEAVLGERLRRDTFKRRMEPGLEPLTDSRGDPATRSDGGRPARLYRHGEAADSPVTRRRLRLPRAEG